MAGLLDGGIASIFGKVFAGLYLPATLRRQVRTETEDGSVTVETELHACRAQLDAVTEAMRQAPGYVDSDQRILILSDTLDVVPTTDDAITVGGREWGIASVASDPARSYWELRGTRR